MGFSIRKTKRPGTPRQEVEVWQLESSAGEVAEVCPALGFNCFRWKSGDWDVLYSDPQFLAGAPPTRSGIPILFPFPNRIRDGRFRWNDKEYQLPLNDPTKKNAIHGFAVRRPWRVVDSGSDEQSAWITGEFHGRVDAPDCVDLWPSDYRIRVTHWLHQLHLTTLAAVDNPGNTPLPFGLGYHHYFRVGNADQVIANADDQWVLIENLPTGEKKPVDDPRDLRFGRKFIDIQVDDLLGGLRGTIDPNGMCLRGSVAHGPRVLQLWTSPEFSELVVYTPPHRQAMCLEPYTCTTDAINLQQRDVEAGLRILAPGEQWSGTVELELTL